MTDGGRLEAVCRDGENTSAWFPWPFDSPVPTCGNASWPLFVSCFQCSGFAILEASAQRLEPFQFSISSVKPFPAIMQFWKAAAFLAPVVVHSHAIPRHGNDNVELPGETNSQPGMRLLYTSSLYKHRLTAIQTSIRVTLRSTYHAKQMTKLLYV